MYVIPLVLIVIVAVIAVAWTPIFALVFAALFVVGFLAYVGLRPRADETARPTGRAADRGGHDASHGIWGEK